MSPSDAAKLLDLPADATSTQLEARFLEMRRKLEDKIAKAPTPGLQAKYRESLAELTTAFETLTLAADSSSLPVLNKQSADPAPIEVGPSSPPAGTKSTVPGRSTRQKSVGKEFALVAVIAVVLLAAGGWWIMQTRAENERKSLAAAEAAQAAKSEADRIAGLKTSLRTKLAEARVDWEAHESGLQDAERRTGELKSELRNPRDFPAEKIAELSAQAAAQEIYTKWLKSHLLRHPAKLARVRAEELLQAGAADEAVAAGEEMFAALAELAREISARQVYFFGATAGLNLRSDPDGVAWFVTDAYGRTHAGTTPFVLEGLPLTHLIADGPPLNQHSVVEKRGELTTGKITVRFVRDGWPDVVKETTAHEADSEIIHAQFPEGALQITAQPAGVPFQATNALGWSESGTTPATLRAVPPGPVTVRLSRPGYQDVTGQAAVVAGGTASIALDQRAQVVTIIVAESNVNIFVDGKLAGQRNVTLADLAPGEHALQLEAKGHRPFRAKFNVKQAGTNLALNYSFNQLLAETITCTTCKGAGLLQHQQTCNQCRGTAKVDCPDCRNGIADYDAEGKWIMCRTCDRKGKLACNSCTNGTAYWQSTCSKCGGDGKVSQLQLSP